MKRTAGGRIGYTAALAAVLFFVLAILVPSATGAAPAFPYEPDTVIVWQELTVAQRSLLEILYTGILRCEERIDLPEGTAYDDVTVVMTALQQDFPELFYLEGHYTTGYYRDTPQWATYVQPTYACTAPEAADAMTRLLRRAAEAAAGAEGDEADRVQHCHDLLVTSVRYDAGSIWCHSAWGALMEGAAVCEGYANAMTLLCRFCGVPAGMVCGIGYSDGRADNHAWNVLELAGMRVQTDVTWDANSTSDPAWPCRWYLNLSAGEMALDHDAEDWRTGGRDGSGMDWYTRQGLTARTDGEAEEILTAQLPELLLSGRPAGVKLTGDASLQRLTERLGELLAGCAEKLSLYGPISYSLVSPGSGMYLTVTR